MDKLFQDNRSTVNKIRESGKSIYTPLEPRDENFWLPNHKLEEILNESLLHDVSLRGLPLRTRSKVAKEAVCRALGYPIPSSFKKTQPRFPGQNFDTYVQKSNNLQIWNEDLDASRRYVLIRLSADDVIQRVKVVDGATLAKLDKTGKLTQKYQARYNPGSVICELASCDTDLVQTFFDGQCYTAELSGSPIDPPCSATLLPIMELSKRLVSLIGKRFPDPGHDQERNRGANLHREICRTMGYSDYQDDGSFPDITAQLVEVKLQTALTIDLGLVVPDSTAGLGFHAIDGRSLRHCDVRYAIFFGETDGATITIKQQVLVTGEDFFRRFTRCEGKVLNKKLQIPLPSNFFDT